MNTKNTYANSSTMKYQHLNQENTLRPETSGLLNVKYVVFPKNTKTKSVKSAYTVLHVTARKPYVTAKSTQEAQQELKDSNNVKDAFTPFWNVGVATPLQDHLPHQSQNIRDLQK